MTPPAVTVIVLSYNHSKFIERSLRSVLNQSFRDFELIYIDNSSGDDTFDRAKRLLSSVDVSFKIEKTPTNLGVSRGINRAFELGARGRYIATLAGDDWWDIYNLERKVAYFDSNPRFGMIYGNGYSYDSESGEIKLIYKTPSVSGHIIRDLLRSVFINSQGILYRHDLLEDLNYFDPAAKVEDRDLWLRIADRAPIGYVHEPLTFYRVNHGGNISNNIQHMREGNEYFFSRYQHRFPDEVRHGRAQMELFFAYSLAQRDPSASSLAHMLRNFQWSVPYTKQMAKCVVGMTRSVLGLRNVTKG